MAKPDLVSRIYRLALELKNQGVIAPVLTIDRDSFALIVTALSKKYHLMGDRIESDRGDELKIYGMRIFKAED